MNGVDYEDITRFDNLSRNERLDIMHNVENNHEKVEFDYMDLFHSFTQIQIKSSMGKSLHEIANELSEEEYINIRGESQWNEHDVIELNEYIIERKRNGY